MDKKIKIPLLALFLAVALFASISFASATVSPENITVYIDDTPVTGTGFVIGSGTGTNTNITINISVAENSEQSGGTFNLTHARVYFASSLTANTTWTQVTAGGFANASDLAGTNRNVTWGIIVNTSMLEDANNYRINITVYNESWTTGTPNANATFARIFTGFTIDNTIPVAPTLTGPPDNSVNNTGTVAFSANINNATTTSCQLRFVGGGPRSDNYNMTVSADRASCSTNISLIPDSHYQWFVRASDESNTTDSAQQRFSVDIKTGSGKAGIFANDPNCIALGGGEFECGTPTTATGFLSSSLVGIPLWFIILAVIVTIFVVRSRRK